MPAKKDLSNIFVQTLEQALDAVVVINSQNNIILFNQAAEKLWGYSLDEVVGKNVKLLVPDALKPIHDDLINANRETGVNKIVGTSRDIEIPRKDGTKLWGSFSLSKVTIDDKILYTAFVKDVTESVLQRQRIEMLSLVTDKTDNAIFITDNRWNIVYVNNGFKNIFGYNESETIGQKPLPLLAPHFDRDRQIKTSALLRDGIPITDDELITSKDGRSLWCSVMTNPVFDDNGELTNVVTVLSEITATKLHEVLHVNVLDSIARDEPLEAIMQVACEEAKKINKDIKPAILGVDDDDKLQLLAGPSLPQGFRQLLTDIKIGEGVGTSGTAAYRQESIIVSDIDTDPLWTDYRQYVEPFGIKSAWSTPIKSRSGKAIGIIAFYSEHEHVPSEIDRLLVNVLLPLCRLAIEREKQRQEIRNLAYYDSLTGLPNRSLLQSKATQAIEEAKENQTNLAVLFLDMDRFKQVNDSLGHPAGDKYLKTIADRIREKCSKDSIYGRLSGDEFVIITPNENPKQLNHFIEELRLCIAEPFDIGGIKASPSSSIGVSVYPDDGHDVSTLIHRADMAMYQAKTAGKGRFAYFSHELNQLAQERQEMEIELEKAIENCSLDLAYQPQINFENGELYGVEALSRWTHPKFGKVSPDKFISLAEECGLIGDLSRCVLKKACQQMSEWRQAGVPIPVISINLSPIDFHNIDLCKDILQILKEYNLQPADILLELTEGVFLDTNPLTMDTLHEIHEQGINFAIDDFGTGYSGLSYLRRIPIKELKLDRSFVDELEHSETSRALSQAVLQIGESLGLRVVAEGIERAGQYDVLKKQGYHVAQGFMFSKALRSNELVQWLDVHSRRNMQPRPQAPQLSQATLLQQA